MNTSQVSLYWNWFDLMDMAWQGFTRKEECEALEREADAIAAVYRTLYGSEIYDYEDAEEETFP